MDFDPNKPVSLDEYNQSVRHSVNSYYEHANNDPSMSKEDVLRTSYEMSEKYLTAVEELQEAKSIKVQDNLTPDIDKGVVENGLDNNGIMDNGILP